MRLARCAAVAAPDFSIELASHVLGLRTLDLADPCAELEQAQVLRDGAFAHDLIYESALASVPAPVARQLHAEVAAFLQQRQRRAGAAGAALGRRPGEWGPAGAAFLAAAERSRQTASLAEQSGLLAEAARCYERAGLPAERFEALLRRARALASNDLGPEASAAVEAVEQAATSDEQRLLALDARLELTMTRYELHESLRLGEQAIAAARTLGRSDLELRFAITLSGALCDARRADEAVALLEPHAPWVREHADVEQQWEYWEATALALDYADRLGDAMPAWEAARAVAQQAERRDMVWKTMSNTASTQAKMGLVAQAAQVAEQAHRLARASNEIVTQRVLQMQVTLAHRLRDVGRYGDALALLEEALAGYRATGASHSDHALAEQRLVVLYQQLGQPARALHLLAPERPGVPRGVAMIRLAHQAELEAQMGRDGLAMMREALKIIPNADDIFHRITTPVRDPPGAGRRRRGDGRQPRALGDRARAARRRPLRPCARRGLRARARRAGARPAARRGGAAPRPALPARQLLPAGDVAGGGAHLDHARPRRRRAQGRRRRARLGRARARHPGAGRIPRELPAPQSGQQRAAGLADRLSRRGAGLSRRRAIRSASRTRLRSLPAGPSSEMPSGAPRRVPSGSESCGKPARPAMQSIRVAWLR